MSSERLIADVAKKSGVVWVAYNNATYPIAHTWFDDAMCAVTGGAEQPLPGIELHDVVTVHLRSKTTRALAATISATVEVIAPDDDAWERTTTALKADRLNLHDMADAVDRWARECLVVRLTPAEVLEVPGRVNP